MTLVQNSLGSPQEVELFSKLRARYLSWVHLYPIFVYFFSGYLGVLIKSSDHRALASHRRT